MKKMISQNIPEDNEHLFDSNSSCIGESEGFSGTTYNFNGTLEQPPQAEKYPPDKKEKPFDSKKTRASPYQEMLTSNKSDYDENQAASFYEDTEVYWLVCYQYCGFQNENNCKTYTKLAQETVDEITKQTNGNICDHWYTQRTARGKNTFYVEYIVNGYSNYFVDHFSEKQIYNSYMGYTLD